MNVADLPYLIRLIDDPSPRIREKIAQKLREIPNLSGEIARQEIALTDAQESLVRRICEEKLDQSVRLVGQDEWSQGFHRTTSQTIHLEDVSEVFPDYAPEMRPSWLGWLEIDDPWDRLESALDALMSWLDMEAAPQSDQPASLPDLLENLSDEFSRSGRAFNADELSEWLFVERGLRGASSADYYRPLNSHLGYVISDRCGIPISLATVFMLLGHRLGMEIHGCNFPGHFLAWAREADGDRFYDCFDRGRLLSPLEVSAIRKAAPEATAAPASIEDIVARFLRNLAAAFEYEGNRTKAHFMLQLLEELESSRGR